MARTRRNFSRMNVGPALSRPYHGRSGYAALGRLGAGPTLLVRRFDCGHGRLVVALRVVAVLDVALALRLLLQEGRRVALRALPGHGAAVQRELALRVARAAVEDPAARAALHQIAFLAVRALHAGRLGRRRLAAADLADRLAVRVAGAAVERAGAAGLDHHLLAAVLAGRLRLGGQVRLHQSRVLRVLAVRVAGAGVELAEAGALELHRLAALVADDLLFPFRHFRGVPLRHLLRGLALRVVRAGQELAEAAELDDHGRAAVGADFVRFQAAALHFRHLRRRAGEVVIEIVGEVAHEVFPLAPSFFDVVQLHFQLRRIALLDDVAERLLEELDDHDAELRQI